MLYMHWIRMDPAKNGESARLEWGKSWVRDPVWSNQTIKSIFVFIRLADSIKEEDWMDRNQDNVSD
jgi:hypothetical protein